MGNTMRIDSLKFARKLEEAGLERKAAEAIAEGVTEVDVSDLATKHDLTDLKSEFAAVRQSISELKADVFKHMWVMGASVVGLTVTLTVGLSKLIP